MKICPVHNIEAVWKEGVSKKTGKAYAFWGCNQKDGDRYCQAEMIEKEGASPTAVKEWNQSIGDERSRKIERQHSQDMALKFLDLLVRTGQINEVTSDLVNKYTDHFAKDLE